MARCHRTGKRMGKSSSTTDAPRAAIPQQWKSNAKSEHCEVTNTSIPPEDICHLQEGREEPPAIISNCSALTPAKDEENTSKPKCIELPKNKIQAMIESVLEDLNIRMKDDDASAKSDHSCATVVKPCSRGAIDDAHEQANENQEPLTAADQGIEEKLGGLHLDTSGRTIKWTESQRIKNYTLEDLFTQKAAEGSQTLPTQRRTIYSQAYVAYTSCIPSIMHKAVSLGVNPEVFNFKTNEFCYSVNLGVYAKLTDEQKDWLIDFSLWTYFISHEPFPFMSPITLTFPPDIPLGTTRPSFPHRMHEPKLYHDPLHRSLQNAKFGECGQGHVRMPTGVENILKDVRRDGWIDAEFIGKDITACSHPINLLNTPRSSALSGNTLYGE